MDKILKYESQGWFWSIAHSRDFPCCVTIWKHLDWRGQPVQKDKPFNPQKREVYSGMGKDFEEAFTEMERKYEKQRT